MTFNTCSGWVLRSLVISLMSVNFWFIRWVTDLLVLFDVALD